MYSFSLFRRRMMSKYSKVRAKVQEVSQRAYKIYICTLFIRPLRYIVTDDDKKF